MGPQIRYSGPIADLHDLVQALADAGFPSDLEPGPTPDVMVHVREHRWRRPDVIDVLDAWADAHPNASASLFGCLVDPSPE